MQRIIFTPVKHVQVRDNVTWIRSLDLREKKNGTYKQKKSMKKNKAKYEISRKTAKEQNNCFLQYGGARGRMTGWLAGKYQRGEWKGRRGQRQEKAKKKRLVCLHSARSWWHPRYFLGLFQSNCMGDTSSLGQRSHLVSSLLRRHGYHKLVTRQNQTEKSNQDLQNKNKRGEWQDLERSINVKVRENEEIKKGGGGDTLLTERPFVSQLQIRHKKKSENQD